MQMMHGPPQPKDDFGMLVLDLMVVGRPTAENEATGREGEAADQLQPATVRFRQLCRD